MTLSLIFAVALLDTVRPARDSGIRINSDQPLIELQACAMRKLSHGADVLPIPIDGGVDVDWVPRTNFGVAGDAPFTLRIREVGGRREIAAYYRHPFSMKAIQNMVRDVGNRCFPRELAVWESQPH